MSEPSYWFPLLEVPDLLDEELLPLLEALRPPDPVEPDLPEDDLEEEPLEADLLLPRLEDFFEDFLVDFFEDFFEDFFDVFLDALFLEAPFLEAPFLEALFLDALFLDALFLEALFLEAPFLERPLDVPERRDDFLDAPFLEALFLEDLPPERLPDDFLDAAFLDDFAIVNGFLMRVKKFLVEIYDDVNELQKLCKSKIIFILITRNNTSLIFNKQCFHVLF